MIRPQILVTQNGVTTEVEPIYLSEQIRFIIFNEHKPVYVEIPHEVVIQYLSIQLAFEIREKKEEDW